MRRRLEDQWKTSADDGDSSPIGIERYRPNLDVWDLLNAWSRESGKKIELGMVLEQSRRFMLRHLNTQALSPKDLKRFEDLLTVIQETLRAADTD